MEVTYKNIKDSILKFIISRDNEKLSQQDIYERLLEVFQISSEGKNTRSKNKYIKEQFLNALMHFKNQRDILFFVESGNIYLQYHDDINNDKNSDSIVDEYIDYEDSDDSYADEYDSDDYNEEDEDETGPENNVAYDIFEKLMSNVEKNEDMITDFRDSYGFTITHHLVRDIKYKHLVGILFENNLFHYDNKTKCDQTPLDLVCEEMRNDVILMYAYRISVKTNDSNSYSRDDVDDIIYAVEKSTKNEIKNLKSTNRMQTFVLVLLSIYVVVDAFQGAIQDVMESVEYHRNIEF
jgi:hypothetical protein